MAGSITESGVPEAMSAAALAPAAMSGTSVTVSVSVVICTYSDERWSRLVAAVESASAQTVAPLEVIVAIDHNPALVARVQSELPDAVAVENSQQRGLSGARNSGVAAARGDVIAFLDDDAVASPDWVEQLMAPYADPNVLGVGGTIDPDWVGGKPAAFPAEFQWVVGCTYDGVPTVTAPVRNMIGANMSLRRDLFVRVGGFRADMGRVGKLPVGCEETELCIRARRRVPGGMFVFEPRARVSHAVPASRATWGYFRSRCFGEGISKALVSSTAGAGDALSSERAYVLRTLPAGVLRALGQTLRGDASAIARAAAIAAGLLLTTAGYLVGTLRGAR